MCRLTFLELHCFALVAYRSLASNGDNLTDDTDQIRKGCSPSLPCSRRSKKKRLVRKLKAARDRKRAVAGKCKAASHGLDQSRARA